MYLNISKDAPATYGQRTDLNRSKGGSSISPPKGAGGLGAGGRSTAHYDDVSTEELKRPSTLSKTYNPSPDREILNAQKGVSFGKTNDVPVPRASDRETKKNDIAFTQSVKVPASGLDFGKAGAGSGAGAPSSFGGAKHESPVKASGFGTGAGGGMKLNLGNVGNQKAPEPGHGHGGHGHSHAAANKPSVYNQEDFDDLDDLDGDF